MLTPDSLLSHLRAARLTLPRYAREALQAVLERDIPVERRLKFNTNAKRGVAVMHLNSRPHMLVQRGYHWDDNDSNGQDGEVGALQACAEDGRVWRVFW